MSDGITKTKVQTLDQPVCWSQIVSVSSKQVSAEGGKSCKLVFETWRRTINHSAF